jgi:RimJ/RimL family protein N-acetyltransferase
MSSNETTVTTERLVLVPFAPEHLDGLFKMNSDPAVMTYLGAPQTRDAVAASITRQQGKWAELGFGWWAVIERATDELIGAACLQHLGHVETNPLEIGWRLMPSAQGKGYATEAGQAAMDYAFNVAGETYLTAVTAPDNKASARVMQRLGMTYIGMQTHYDVDCVTYEIHKKDRR